MASASTTTQTKTGQPDLNPLVGAVTIMRPVAAHDLPVLEAWDEDPEIIALMGRKYADRSTTDWFRSLQGRRTCRAWVIMTHDQRLIGELELAEINWRAGTAELRICIGEKDCWSHGFGTDAIQSALRMAFGHYELRSIYLRVFATNERAVRVYQRLGFRKEAILTPSSRREDPAPVLLMSLTRQRWQVRTAG